MNALCLSVVAAAILVAAFPAGLRDGDFAGSRLSREAFHDNCLGKGGRFGALRGQVLCLFADRARLACDFDGRVGNCMWSGPIRAERLALPGLRRLG
jgi:hypothetical protein